MFPLFEDDDYIFEHQDNSRTAVAREVTIYARQLTEHQKNILAQYSEHLRLSLSGSEGLGFFAEIPGTFKYTLMATDRFWLFFCNKLFKGEKLSDISTAMLLNKVLELSARDEAHRSQKQNRFSYSKVS
jgi:hypothetical protein